MYSKFKIGFFRFFGLDYERLIERPLRHAFSMGDPLRDSRRSQDFYKNERNKSSSIAYNLIFSNISKVFYNFLNNLSLLYNR